MIATALAITLAGSFVLTWFVRRLATRRGMLDLPNARSSHSVPTPRGGGLAIAIASLIGCSILVAERAIENRLALTLLLGGSTLALVGWMDDRASVSVSWRLVVHFGASIFAATMLGGMPVMHFDSMTMDWGIVGVGVAAVGVVWVLNLFNFMDGIDGLAASEAIFIGVAGGLLDYAGGIDPKTAAMSFIVAAASLGFLLWNWPPAKIFMGDVGSGFLGFVIAALALASGNQNHVMFFVWLILGGAFFVDATVTLARRLVAGERVYIAHRSHAYQWLSRRWNSHLRVTCVLWAINLGWLFPIAWLCVQYRAYAAAFVGLALSPLIVLALWAGAGKRESVTQSR